MESYLLMLYVTLEQEVAIRDLFDRHHWLFQKKVAEVTESCHAEDDGGCMADNNKFHSTNETALQDYGIPVQTALQNKDSVKLGDEKSSCPAMSTRKEVELVSEPNPLLPDFSVSRDEGLHQSLMISSVSDSSNDRMSDQADNFIPVSSFFNREKNCQPEVDTENKTIPPFTSERRDLDCKQSFASMYMDFNGSSDVRSWKVFTTHNEYNINMPIKPLPTHELPTAPELASARVKVETEGAESEDFQIKREPENIEEAVEFQHSVCKTKSYTSVAELAQNDSSVGEKNESTVVDNILKKNVDLSEEVQEESESTRKSSSQSNSVVSPGDLVCETCGRSFTYRAHYWKHTTSGKCVNICEYCGKSFNLNMKVAYRKHLWACAGNNITSLQCTVCGAKFQDKKLLQIHIMIHDKETKNGQSSRPEMPSTQELSVHVKVENQISDTLEVNEHRIKREPGEEEENPDLQYSKCENQNYISGLSLTQSSSGDKTEDIQSTSYILDPSLTQSRQSSEDKTRDEQRTKGLQCIMCRAIFQDRNTLKLHKMGHTGDRPYSCDLCDKTYKTSGERNRHRKTHAGQKKVKCDQCGAVYSIAGLRAHKLLVHSTGAQLQCDVCQKLFPDSWVLKMHIKKVHPSPEEYLRCTDCPKTFKNSSSLSAHRKTVHLKQYRYTCDICGKKVVDKKNLEEHKRSHTGEKPYKCDYCEHRCTIKRNLKSHYLRVHNLTL